MAGLPINQIICADAITEMKKFPNKSIDYIFTSPPFKDEDVEGGDYWEFYDKFMEEVNRITKEYAFIFNSSTKMVEIIRRYKTPFRILMWIKPIVLFNCKYCPIFVYDFETTTFNLNKTLYSDTWPYKPTKNRKHKYQDPLNLYVALLGFLPDGIVLDPFLGSGTTAIACRLLNKKFIGIEIYLEIIKLAKKRLSLRTVKLENFVKT